MNKDPVFKNNIKGVRAGLFLTAGCPQPATWVVCAGYFWDKYSFKDKLLVHYVEFWELHVENH